MSYTIKDNDKWFIDMYVSVKSYTIEAITANDRKIFHELCKEFIERIILGDPCEFTKNICSIVIIQLFLPFFMECSRKYTIIGDISAYIPVLDELKSSYTQNVFLGKDLKQYGFANLTLYPDKAQELLDSCNDEVEYCMMNPLFFIIDYKQVRYLCNESSLIKITEHTTTIAPGRYLYCIIPDGTLCLFENHHSAGACGQPVICAGYITIENNKIKEIDNNSGHYAPPPYMLERAISLLKTQNLIVSTEKIQRELSSEHIVHYIFETNGGRIKKSIKRCKTNKSGKRRKYTRRMRKKRI